MQAMRVDPEIVGSRLLPAQLIELNGIGLFPSAEIIILPCFFGSVFLRIWVAMPSPLRLRTQRHPCRIQLGEGLQSGGIYCHSKIAIPHLGKNSVQGFMERLNEMLDCFTKGLTAVNDLSNVTVKNPINTAKRVFKEILGLPRKEALEVLEDFKVQHGSKPVTAFDLLLVVNEIAQRRIELDPKNLTENIKFTDLVTKAITIRWARYEAAGEYPW